MSAFLDFVFRNPLRLLSKLPEGKNIQNHSPAQYALPLFKNDILTLYSNFA